MAHNEFAIIRQYFSDIGAPGANTVLDIGDDAAVVEVPYGYQQVVCMDTLNAGVHFPLDTDPADIACKALAVNLSDLAAMAAEPDWFQMSLSLPHSEPAWIEAFAAELRRSAETHGIRLIGGDTCHGELSITVQVAGLVKAGEFVTRAGAQPGDLVLVSGELGSAGLGLAHLQGRVELPADLQAHCIERLNRPRPRLELVDFLRSFATSAIDISDGLQGDLGHILEASGRGARIDRDSIPVLPWLAQQDLYEFALGAGDDYEICCTVPPGCRAEIDLWNRKHPNCRLTAIGEIGETGFELRVGDAIVDLSHARGYRHFD